MTRTWLLVTGDFVPSGGQDRANYELAHHLASSAGNEVHLVCHRVHKDLQARANVHLHLARRPLGSHLLGAIFLKSAAKAIRKRLRREATGVTIIGNGGNFDGGDLSWVHAVHAVWQVRDEEAPWMARLKNRLGKLLAIREERRALLGARLIMVNSDRSSKQLMELGVPRARLRTVYLGSDNDAATVTDAERLAARREHRISPSAVVAVFIGSLGYDRNKGFDIALEITNWLRSDRGWHISLLAAGGGNLEFWARRVRRAGLDDCVRLLGHMESTRKVIAAADFLLSPSRYESYGLAVHEALSREIPAFVSSTAGIAELLPRSLSFLKFVDVEDGIGCARRVSDAVPLSSERRAALTNFASSLRQRTWQTMALEIAECAAPINCATS